MAVLIAATMQIGAESGSGEIAPSLHKEWRVAVGASDVAVVTAAAAADAGGVTTHGGGARAVSAAVASRLTASTAGGAVVAVSPGEEQRDGSGSRAIRSDA